ncbi:MAG TPA: PKD domain-containing protein, partial [Methanoculleus sp.]|nr:PKD domain-containing protein [Methanoculleus sp.]
MKPQHGIVLVLLIGLIAGAAAAGDLPPALPHEFYGNVAIDGSPAPAGTVVTAMIGGTACGSVEVTSPGRYGDPDWNLGNRLLVTGTEGQNGETITFLVDGGAADQTAPFTPGRVTRLDLSFEETVTVPTARFTANVTSGPAPLAVRFADASTGDPDSWFWDFGDGENSAERSPTHTYTTPGTYTANLTVANAAGSNSATATIIVQEAGAVEIVRGPYFTGTTTTATFVNWMTQEPVAGTVEYADDAYYAANGGYALSVADTAETAFHRVALEDLTPGTLYHYRIVAGNTTLGDRTFRTFPEDGGFTFIVYGDTQLPANIKIVADRIADEDPLFILHTGDQVNAVESVDEWNNFFSSNRRLLANTTIYTTLGNHEYNDTVYYETFGLPQWYSFVCADARFAVLDDNFASNPLPETAWLARDLTNDTAWKFVANHHPPYSSTSDRAGGWLYPRAWWGQIMQDNGVTAVFNGHVHAYERYIVDGITYLVTGTGAGSLHPLGPANERPAGYQNSLVHTLGYTKITVHDNGTATGQFVQVARLDPNNSSQVLEVYPPGTAFETYTLTPRARGADLAAVSLDVPAGIVAGNACTVNGTVENLGGTVAGACPVTLAADGDLIGNLTVDPLAPGETAEVSFTWTPAAAGEAVLTLSVDPASTVPDIDRTNN